MVVQNDIAPGLHRRQFVLGPRPVTPDATWRPRQVSQDLFLSHSLSLPVLEAQDRDGVPWLLLGRAVSIHADAPSIVEQISMASSKDVPQRTFGWSGRWALISPSGTFTDASALLGTFYCHDSDKNIWVSSSCALLMEYALGHKATLADTRGLRYETGLSWFPPPRTRHAEIRRLLPSQALDFGRGQPVPRRWMPTIKKNGERQEGFEWLAVAIRSVLENLVETGDGPLHLGLTAGYDSRLMLAIADAAKVPLNSFTRLTVRMSLADRFVPPRLAALTGIPHDFLQEGSIAPASETLISRHALNMVSHGDAAPLLRDGRAGLSGISIGGHGFAIASGFANWRKLPDVLPEQDAAVASIMKVLNEPQGSTGADGLREWIAWARETPVPGLDWRDRMFLEQRQAGWLAAKEQLYDVQPLERFPVLNSAEIYARLLSITEERRLGSRVQAAVIETVSTDLAAEPYNPPDWQFAWRRPHSVAGRYCTRAVKKIAGRARRLRARS